MAMNLHISLRNKILSEYCEFRKSQEQLKPKDVYENAYEIVIKQNIKDLICDENVTLTSEHKLAVMLSLWPSMPFFSKIRTVVDSVLKCGRGSS